jgi:hypothetical protein
MRAHASGTPLSSAGGASDASRCEGQGFRRGCIGEPASTQVQRSMIAERRTGHCSVRQASAQRDANIDDKLLQREGAREGRGRHLDAVGAA